MVTKSIFLQTLFLAPMLVMASGAEDYDLWKKGRKHWYQNEWEQAAGVYQTLIDQYPDSNFRCKSEYSLGYCLHKMGKLGQAFEVFSRHIEEGTCQSSTLDDAKSTRLQIAYEMTPENPAMKQVLLDGLLDPNPDIRLSSAVWLSELNDPSGLEVFFQTLKTEEDQDRRDTAARHILKLGTSADKARLEKLLSEIQERIETKKPKMVRLIIRDLKDNRETLKVNLPIGLFNVVIKSFTDEQLKLIEEEAGIDLRNLRINIDDFRSGTQLFEVRDGNQEIKLFLE